VGPDHRAEPDGGVPLDAAGAADDEGEGLGADHQHRIAHSLVASPNKAPYVASKHGVAGFTKAVALETAPTGVTVNCISPGYVWTGLVENQIPDTMRTRGLTREQVINDVLLAAQPTKQFVQVEQVAALAVFLCRDEASAITGANLSMDGGWTAQ
jgi:3-hydroxybutyrate dehydrogenase